MAGVVVVCCFFSVVLSYFESVHIPYILVPVLQTYSTDVTSRLVVLTNEKCRETEKSPNDARCAKTKEKERYSLDTNATVEELIVKHYNVLQLRHKSSSTSIIHGCVHTHILLSHSAPNAFCTISHFET